MVTRYVWNARMSRCDATNVLLLFCLLSFSAILVTGIHEDEQGLRDWILRFVGHVEHAALYPHSKSDQVYVTSAQGAVAALSLTNGTLLWRKVLSEPQACIAAAKGAVLVSSKRGVAHLLNVNSGAVEATFKLLLTTNSSVMHCAYFSGHQLKIAAADSENAYIFQIGKETEDEEIRPERMFPVGRDVRELRLGSNHMWVVRHSTADRYSLGGALEVKGVEATGGISPSPSGGAVAYADPRVTVIRDNNVSLAEEQTGTTSHCSGCSASVLIGSAGTFKGSVMAKPAEKGFIVKFPGNEVHVPSNGTVPAAPTILLAVSDTELGDWALVRASNGHLIAVFEEVGVRWERWEGLASLAATVFTRNTLANDRFGFSKDVVGVSTYGVVYIVPVVEMGREIRILADLTSLLLQNTGAVSMSSIKIEQLSLSGNSVVTLIVSCGKVAVSVALDLATNTVFNVSRHEDVLLVAPTFSLDRSLTVSGVAPQSPLHVFRVNATAGVVEGYFVSATSPTTSLWTVRIPYRIVAYASGVDSLRTTVVNHLRVFPSVKPEVQEVRRKFPTRNILAVAHYEPADDELPTLVITAIDTVTGSVLATMRHRNVEGRVHLLIAEHAVLYHYMDAEKMRHSLGVWEMFEDEVGAALLKDAGATLPQIATSFFQHKRTFSSRATRPPFVSGAVLGIQGGELAGMSLTTSFGAIARRSVLLLFESGRVASVELNRLLAGGQAPVDESGRQATHVFFPGTSLITYKYRVARPTLIAVEPTNLESSCHVLVSGMDLFYVRASSGKEFDLLNSDFNKSLLVALTLGLGFFSLVAHYFAARKMVNDLWG
ncbi:putative Protein of unknown function (DUF1620) [Trypanosoma vivax]|nr:putative Protein of unknown function (DUF1620) [Trypanosoma vivax]